MRLLPPAQRSANELMRHAKVRAHALWPSSFIYLLLLIGVAGCWRQSRWRRTDEFVQQLRCGMSRAEIEQLAHRYRGLNLQPPASGVSEWNLVATKDTSRIAMKVEANGLRRIQVSWIGTIMHVQFLRELDLCSVVPPNREGR